MAGVACPVGPRPAPRHLAGMPTRLAAAAALVLGAFWLRELLARGLGPLPPFITFYPTVVLVALALGALSGVFATVLATVVVSYWVLEPQGQWHLTSRSDLATLSLFFLGGVVLSTFAFFHQRVRHRATALETAEALRAPLERLKLALQAVRAATWEWNTTTGENVWSDEMWQLIGRAPGSLPTTHEAWLSTIDPRDRPAVARLVGEAVRQGLEAEVAYRVLGPGDGCRWLLSKAVPLRDAGGALTGYLGIAFDVTQQKRAEEALAASERRFRDVTASVGEYVFEMDARGVITYAGEAVEATLGYRSEEVVGRSAFDFLDAQDQGQSSAFLAERVSRRDRFALLGKRASHRSGRPVWLDVTAMPITAADGELQGYRGVVLDVTSRHEAEAERERLQAQLVQAQKMESVGRLAGGVAHDFNNLLTVILGCSESLQERLDGGQIESLQDAEQIHAAGERARDLTGQLLAFARKQVVTPVPLDLNAVVQRCQRMLERLLGEDIDLVLDLQPAPWTVLADPGQVEQVVLNLAVNARDAMPTGGRLVIETRNRRTGEDGAPEGQAGCTGARVQLRVRDTGVGMTPEVRAHLFEPFFTTKEPGKGTGLGLATVHGIVAQAGGHVHVESEPGRGTTLRVCFPRVPMEAASAPEPSASASPHGTERVLVVEDNAGVRAVLSRTLRGAGYRVTALDHPQRALDLAAAELEPLQLLLTDVVMPGLDGRTLADELCRRVPDLRVLYVSGYTQEAILGARRPRLRGRLPGQALHPLRAPGEGPRGPRRRGHRGEARYPSSRW